MNAYDIIRYEFRPAQAGSNSTISIDQSLEVQGTQDPDCIDMSNIYLGLFLNKVSYLE